MIILLEELFALSVQVVKAKALPDVLQQETTERQSRLEQEQKALADALTAAEKKVTEEKGVCFGSLRE